MTGTLVRSQTQTKTHSQDEVFVCPEESHFYSHCLEHLLFSHCTECDRVIEFGCGDGSPVINSLLRIQFKSAIYGYELNASACEIARSRIRQYDLSHQYVIHNQSFFEAHKPDANCLIANPPYLPAIDDRIRMPLLHGGSDGASITNRLSCLSFKFPDRSSCSKCFRDQNMQFRSKTAYYHWNIRR